MPGRTSRADRPLPAATERQPLLQRLGEIVLHRLARDVAAQEIGPQEFAERRRILGETAGPAHLAGKAAERIVLEILDRFRNVPEVPALALGVIGIDPALVVHHAPEHVTLDHREIADHGDQDVLDALLVQRPRHVMMIDHVIAIVGTMDDRDHVLAQKLGTLLVGLVLAPALPFLLYLMHADRHLGRPQRHDRNRFDVGLARMGHDVCSRLTGTPE